MSDQIVVLSHRPGSVKSIHDLHAMAELTPMMRRSHPQFQTLFHAVWEELDVNV